MTSALSSPRKLSRGDDCSDFDSGAPELDQWLVRYAYANLRANNATTYVALRGAKVVAYYAIAMAAVERDEAPERLRHGSRPAQIPCLLLARLAVDTSEQGNGIGAGMLRDALRRALQLSDAVGAAAVLVHARDDAAKRFYEANGNFLESPVDLLQPMVPMKALRSIFV